MVLNPRRRSGDHAEPPPRRAPRGIRNGEGAAGFAPLLKRTFKDFADDECPRMAAALSYYTIFSLPPLLMLVLLVTGLFVDSQAVAGRIEGSVASAVGAAAAGQVREIIRIADSPGGANLWATVLSLGALLLGATGAFAELQKALNRAWEVEPDPEKGGLMRVLLKRLLSLGMAVTIAFLLLVSMLLSAVVSAFGERLSAMAPGALSQPLMQGVELLLSLAVAVALFALMFKVLPDARTRWRDIWVGALATGLLFTAGKFALGFYLARSDPGAAFGAAGSLALLLVWVYYTAMIVFVGAEFTQAWAVGRGAGIEPDKDAVRLVEETPGTRKGRG